jgi:hypothetical protein
MRPTSLNFCSTGTILIKIIAMEQCLEILFPHVFFATVCMLVNKFVQHVSTGIVVVGFVLDYILRLISIYRG